MTLDGLTLDCIKEQVAKCCTRKGKQPSRHYQAEATKPHVPEYQDRKEFLQVLVQFCGAAVVPYP